MKSHCVKHRDFTNLAALVDFGELYLRAQMELEGVLGVKPTWIHPISTLEQLWRAPEHSRKNEIKIVIFFVNFPGL